MDKKVKPKSNNHSKRSHSSHALDELVTGQQEKTFSHRTSKRNNLSSYSSQHGPIKSGKQTALNRGQDQEDQEVIQVSAIKQRSAEQVTEFINKLIAKNKISSKNAFDVPMIHLDQTKDFRSDLNQNTWKNLSSTLENDYKIYGYRVDATHTITYKMVQSIARHEANTSQAISDYKEQKEQEKKYKLDLASTSLSKDYTGSLAKFIQKNVKLLNVNQLQSFFSYNPGLQRTKRKFDQQGLKALLLNNIQIRENGQLRLDQQSQQNNESKIQCQGRNFNQTLNCDQVFQKISFELENGQIGKCFQEVYLLNINQGGADSQETNKLLRLYRIVSGEERQEKKRKKKQEQIMLELNINSVPEDAKNQNISDNKKKPVAMEAQSSAIQDNQGLINPQHSQFIQNIINEQFQGIQIDKKKQEQEKQQRMKVLNEGLKQLNLDYIQEDAQQQHSYSRLDYSNQQTYEQKMRKIDQYISIKDRKQKKNRTKIKKDLNSQEIGKKLFNRKIKTKKHTDSEAEIQQPKTTTKKINFLQAKKILKRGTVFKKSVYEQKIFYKTKQIIKQKIEVLQKDRVQKQQKRAKNKKKSHFDLPAYKIFTDQTNLAQDLDQFEQKSKDQSFIFSVMPSFIQHVKQLKRQRLEQEKLKLLELQQNQMITVQGEQILNQCQQIEQFDILKMEDYMEKIRKTYQVTIKDTKDKMKNMLVKNQNIKSHTYDFRSLYENYYQSEGFISPALCFLTVLHLANQNNLQLQGNQEGQNFNISNLQNILHANNTLQQKQRTKIQDDSILPVEPKRTQTLPKFNNQTKKLINYQGSENSESMQVQM